MTASTNEVREFFDRIAADYADKYSGADAFHEYFFKERLDEATRGIDLIGKRVLDVGAGTGNLYERLRQVDPDVDYYGTDISSAMLANSSIPPERRFVGSLADIRLPAADFDLAFMLGVTTYIDDAELAATLDRIYKVLKPGGSLVITFTNEASLDWKVRKVFKFAARKFVPRKNVLGQSFTVFPRRREEIEGRLAGRFTVEDVRFLNHTVFPFTNLFKRTSVRAAKRIHRTSLTGELKSRLSSDLLFILQKV